MAAQVHPSNQSEVSNVQTHNEAVLRHLLMMAWVIMCSLRRVDHLGRTYHVDHNTRTVTWNRSSPNQATGQEGASQEIATAREGHNRRVIADDLSESSGVRRTVSAIGSPGSVTPGVVGNNQSTMTAGVGPLPAGWEERHTHEGRPYLVDHNTRTTVVMQCGELGMPCTRTAQNQLIHALSAI